MIFFLQFYTIYPTKIKKQRLNKINDFSISYKNLILEALKKIINTFN